MQTFMTRISGRKRRFEAGFSLTEVMAAVFIMAILGTVVVVNVAPAIGDTRLKTGRLQIQNLSRALEQYNLTMFDYPTQQQGLEALVRMPEGLADPASYPLGGFINDLPLDPWNRAYVYTRPGQRSGRAYDLFSLGADGQPGGEGPNADIGNWK